MDAELEVIFSKTNLGEPLATVRNLPGLDADLTPMQMRKLALALNQAASDCENYKSELGISLRTIHTYKL